MTDRKIEIVGYRTKGSLPPYKPGEPCMLYWMDVEGLDGNILAVYLSRRELQKLVDSVYKVEGLVARGVGATDLLRSYRIGRRRKGNA